MTIMVPLISFSRATGRYLLVSSKTKTLVPTSTRSLATKPEIAQIEASEENTKTREALEAEKSSVQKYTEKTRELDPHMVWGITTPPPDPILPDDPSEVAALDPAHMNQDPLNLSTGVSRVVQIKQVASKVTQAPNNSEKKWTISFMDEGELSHCWDNPLMGWVSSSDPMANNMQLQMYFENASAAVYFAKKRGWKYVVEEPRMRKGRDDNAQYQDNFLPQDIALKVRQQKKDCNHWSREKAGTSNYFRPLKYHGCGIVAQHGPNGDANTVNHVEGKYKMR